VSARRGVRGLRVGGEGAGVVKDERWGMRDELGGVNEGQIEHAAHRTRQAQLAPR